MHGEEDFVLVCGMAGNKGIGSEGHITVVDKVWYNYNENYKLAWGLIVLPFLPSVQYLKWFFLVFFFQ